MIGKCLTKSGGSDNPWVISQASDMEKYRNKDYEGQFIKYTGPQTNEYKPGTYQVVANFFNVGDTVNSLYYSFSNTEVNQTLLKNLYIDIASTGTITNEDGRWFTYFFSDYLVQRNYTLLKFDNGKELVMTWLYGQEGPGSTIKHDEYYLGYGTRTDYQAQPRNSLVVVVDGDTVKTVNNTEVLSTVQYINKNSGPVNKYVYKNSPYSYVLAPVYSLAKLQTPAVNNDIIPGKEAYDDNGNKLTGNLKSYNNPLKPASQEEYDAIIAGNDYLNNYIEFNSKTTKTEVGEYSGTWAMGDRVTAIYFDTSKTPEKPTDWSTYDHSIDVGSTIKFKTLMSSDVNASIGLPRGLYWGYGRASDGSNATFIMESETGAFIWSDIAITGDEPAGWQYSVLTGDLKNKLEIDPDYAYTLTIISDSYNWNGVYTYKNSPTKEVKTYYPLDPLTNTATASEIAKDKEVYDGEGNKIVGTYELRLQEKTATPGLNPQNILPDNGYTGLSKVMVDGVGITPAKTVTPGTADINVEPDAGDLGIESVLVGGDANLVAGNIKKDVSIFGVVGTLEGTNDPDAGKLKLGRPSVVIDWDKDILNIFGNPYYVTPQSSTSYSISIDGVETNIEGSNINGTSSNSNASLRPKNFYIYKSNGCKLDTLGIGEHIIKCKTKAYSIQNIDSNGFVFDKPVGYIDSDYTDEIIYDKYSFTNTAQSLGLVGETSGVLNSHKYDTGKLLTYNPSIPYNFDLDPSGRGSSDYTQYYDILRMQTKDFSLISDGYNYSSSFAKVSFTLSETREVKVKYQITKSASTTPSIVIGPMDTNYTSFSYNNKLSNAVVTYNTSTDFEEKEYSFGTLEPGEHFYFVQFYCYGSTFYDKWSASITPVFEKIPTGKYLPVDITVTNSNEPVAKYTYSPYTGEFSIPMTGTITMNAVGADQPVLEELIVTPSTWDVHTSVLTWDYPVAEVTYHIETPDGQEYTTTEKQYNLTGKLGEASSDYKQVKIWAVSTDNTSGKTAINLIYNPNNEFFNKTRIEDAPNFYIDSYGFPFNYKNDAYILNDNDSKIYKYNGEIFQEYMDLSSTVTSTSYWNSAIYSQLDNCIYTTKETSDSNIYEINIETKNITARTDLTPSSPDFTKTFKYAILKDDTIYWWNREAPKVYYCKKDFSDFSNYSNIAVPSDTAPYDVIITNKGTIFFNDGNDQSNILDTANKVLHQVRVDNRLLGSISHAVETDTQYIFFKNRNAIYVNKESMTTVKTISLESGINNIFKLKDSVDFIEGNTYKYVKVLDNGIEQITLGSSIISSKYFGRSSYKTERFVAEYNGWKLTKTDGQKNTWLI